MSVTAWRRDCVCVIPYSGMRIAEAASHMTTCRENLILSIVYDDERVGGRVPRRVRGWVSFRPKSVVSCAPGRGRPTLRSPGQGALSHLAQPSVTTGTVQMRR